MDEDTQCYVNSGSSQILHEASILVTGAALTGQDSSRPVYFSNWFLGKVVGVFWCVVLLKIFLGEDNA